MTRVPTWPSCNGAVRTEGIALLFCDQDLVALRGREGPTRRPFCFCFCFCFCFGFEVALSSGLDDSVPGPSLVTVIRSSAASLPARCTSRA
jgi:hypothetical protein